MKTAYSFGIEKTWDNKWILVYHSCGGVMHFVKTCKDYEDAYKTAVAYNNNKPEKVFVEK